MCVNAYKVERSRPTLQLVKKEHKLAFEYFMKSHKKGNINAAYQLYLLHSKAEEYLDVKKAYKYLHKSAECGLPCNAELNAYFKEHLMELKDLDESWKSWSDENILNLHEAEIIKMGEKFIKARETDSLYKRPSAPFMDNNGNWFLTVQVKNFIKYALDRTSVV